MEFLYKRFKDIADFRMVYINEAHPCDGGEPSDKTLEKELFTHRSWEDRRDAANKFIKDYKLTIPCLIDNLDNRADLMYHAWPDKIYLIRSDNTIAVSGADGPVGFGPAMEDVGDWLLEFESTQIEPKPIVRPQDFSMIVGAEIKPTGHQTDLLEQVDAFNAERDMKKLARKSKSSGKSSSRKDKSSSAEPATHVLEPRVPFDEAAHEREREVDSASFPIKPWHIFAGTALLIALAIWVSLGTAKKTER